MVLGIYYKSRCIISLYIIVITLHSLVKGIYLVGKIIYLL